MWLRIPCSTYINDKLCVAVLGLMLFYPSPAIASAEDRTSDVFLSGYIASVLERDLDWPRDSYHLQIVKGVATITLFQEDPIREEEANKELLEIDGLQRLTIVVQPASVGNPVKPATFMGITGEGESFPTGDLFQPLIADPKQPQFSVSVNRFKSQGLRYTRASVSFGETFGFYRFFGEKEGDGLQFSLEAGLFGQFNLDTPSANLINADYTIGLPVSYRYGDNSLRFRIYHQSSHLGDELLLGDNPPERINLSFEAVELLYARQWRNWRAYGGGEYLVHKEPSDLKPASGHWGIEYQGSQTLFWNSRPIGGIDMKSLEEHDWAIDTSIKVGLEFGHPNPGQRRLRLMIEWYNGFDPYGQFYNNKVDYFGIGVSLGF